MESAGARTPSSTPRTVKRRQGCCSTWFPGEAYASLPWAERKNRGARHPFNFNNKLFALVVSQAVGLILVYYSRTELWFVFVAALGVYLLPIVGALGRHIAYPKPKYRPYRGHWLHALTDFECDTSLLRAQAANPVAASLTSKTASSRQTEADKLLTKTGLLDNTQKLCNDVRALLVGHAAPWWFLLASSVLWIMTFGPIVFWHLYYNEEGVSLFFYDFCKEGSVDDPSIRSSTAPCFVLGQALTIALGLYLLSIVLTGLCVVSSTNEKFVNVTALKVIPLDWSAPRVSEVLRLLTAALKDRYPTFFSGAGQPADEDHDTLAIVKFFSGVFHMRTEGRILVSVFAACIPLVADKFRELAPRSHFAFAAFPVFVVFGSTYLMLTVLHNLGTWYWLSQDIVTFLGSDHVVYRLLLADEVLLGDSPAGGGDDTDDEEQKSSGDGGVGSASRSSLNVSNKVHPISTPLTPTETKAEGPLMVGVPSRSSVSRRHSAVASLELFDPMYDTNKTGHFKSELAKMRERTAGRGSPYVPAKHGGSVDTSVAVRAPTPLWATHPFYWMRLRQYCVETILSHRHKVGSLALGALSTAFILASSMFVVVVFVFPEPVLENFARLQGILIVFVFAISTVGLLVRAAQCYVSQQRHIEILERANIRATFMLQEIREAADKRWKRALMYLTLSPHMSRQILEHDPFPKVFGVPVKPTAVKLIASYMVIVLGSLATRLLFPSFG